MNPIYKTPDSSGGVSLGIVLHAATEEIVVVHNINHRDPRRRIVGGTAREGETPQQTLIRELWEETGLVPSHTVYLFSVLAYSKLHYYHVYGCIVDNFNGLKKGPVRDGKSLLVPEITTAQEALGAPKFMVPQHRVMLRMGIQRIKDIILT